MVGGEIDGQTGAGLPEDHRHGAPADGEDTLFLAFQIHRCNSPDWSHPQRSAFTAQSGRNARDKWLDELFPLIRRRGN